MSSDHHKKVAMRTLEVFETAARSGSFTAAGQALSITQSAVSRQIADLENVLGVQLFVRAGPRVALTAEGRELADGVGRGFRMVEAAVAHMRAANGNVVTLSMLPSVAAKWFSPRLGQFLAAHADIDLRIAAARHLVDFRAEGIDAAIRYGRGDWPFVKSILLAEEFVFPVCTADYAARLALSAPHDLARATLLHTDIVDDWAAWFRAAGGTPLLTGRSPRMEDDTAVLQAALSGQGVALGRSVLVADDLAAGRLVAPFAVQLPASYRYWFVYPAEKLPTPALKAVERWVVEAFAR